jgi:hypothetical protein
LSREKVEQRRQLRPAPDACEHERRRAASLGLDADRGRARDAIEARMRQLNVGDIGERDFARVRGRAGDDAEVREGVADAARVEQGTPGAAAPQQPLPGQRNLGARTAY